MVPCQNWRLDLMDSRAANGTVIPVLRRTRILLLTMAGQALGKIILAAEGALQFGKPVRGR